MLKDGFYELTATIVFCLNMGRFLFNCVLVYPVQLSRNRYKTLIKQTLRVRFLYDIKYFTEIISVHFKRVLELDYNFRSKIH